MTENPKPRDTDEEANDLKTTGLRAVWLLMTVLNLFLFPAVLESYAAGDLGVQFPLMLVVGFFLSANQAIKYKKNDTSRTDPD